MWDPFGWLYREPADGLNVEGQEGSNRLYFCFEQLHRRWYCDSQWKNDPGDIANKSFLSDL